MSRRDLDAVVSEATAEPHMFTMFGEEWEVPHTSEWDPDVIDLVDMGHLGGAFRKLMATDETDEDGRDQAARFFDHRPKIKHLEAILELVEDEEGLGDGSGNSSGSSRSSRTTRAPSRQTSRGTTRSGSRSSGNRKQREPAET